MAVQTKKTSRNAPCPCGSGKKFKRCCLQRGSHSHESVAAIVDQATPNRLSDLIPKLSSSRRVDLSDDESDLRDVWKELHLDAPLPDGTALHIVLLHSEYWLRKERVGAGHGMTVYLPQISYEGMAILTAVRPAERAATTEGELKIVLHRSDDNDNGLLVLGARRNRIKGSFAERCANLRLISVEFIERRGHLARRVDIELLRSLDWIRRQDVRVGGTVSLDEPTRGGAREGQGQGNSTMSPTRTMVAEDARRGIQTLVMPGWRPQDRF